ncbi:MAG: hypothetical protein ACOYCA_00735 [Eggerthellaceae bacterium]|jgi:hypothetical protein
MLSLDERVAEVERRTRRREARIRAVRRRAIRISSAAACLVICVGLGLVASQTGSQATGIGMSSIGMAGSIIQDSPIVGYVAVIVLAAILGVIITIIAFRALWQSQEDDDDDDD